MLTLGSLFSGIGGIELGFERTGAFKTIWHSEIEAYPSAVLEENFPGVKNYGDITKIDWGKVERPDVLCGGFPCQDISVAGKGAGIKEGTRSGLWSEYARAIRELRPRYVVVENVPMLARRGLTRVLGDLAALGYDAEWKIVSAASVGAPHRRERLFIIAYDAEMRRCDGGEHPSNGAASRYNPPIETSEGIIAHAHNRAGTGEQDAKFADAGRKPSLEGNPPRSDGGGVDVANADDAGGSPSQRGTDGDRKEDAESGEREPQLVPLGRALAPHPDHNGALGQARAEEGRRRLQAEPHDGTNAPDPTGGRPNLTDNQRRVDGEGGDELLAREQGNVDSEGDAKQGRGTDAPDLRSHATQGFAPGDVRRFPEFAWCEDIRCVKDLFNRPDLPEPLVRRADDGVPSRLDNYTRIERTKALGNAVVPACAEVVARRVLEMEAQNAK
jgi:DNA (cytosine-5)-methyltransferase 1